MAISGGRWICVLALFAAGCSKASIDNLANSIDIFSNRPQRPTADLYVITLTEPPLLKTAQKTQNGWSIAESDKEKILAEQRSFEASLKERAPDAEIVFKYRLILNGLAVFATPQQIETVRSLTPVKSITAAMTLRRPTTQIRPTLKVSEMNSVKFIGAEAAHQAGILGRGISVGIIDTGIDYTHAMLGGKGDPEEFAGIDASKDSPSFPNAKVVGGVDLAGSDFDASSPYNSLHRPIPDRNPIDEGGHGTHVAGTVAGVGDGVNTYSGVAPEATVHAIKVFGKEGSTSDAVVIAGLEYAADPDGDLDPADQLDVVNLSLGGGFGGPKLLYTEAVRNLSQAGTVVIAAAGNSGPIDYVVGAPSTADDALSVAASVDGSPHNWQFDAVEFQTAEGLRFVKVVEGPVSLPIAEAGNVSGELVDAGLGDVDFAEDMKARLKGRVALLKRGGVTFETKIRRAYAAGSIGAVIVNNAPGEPIAMGGESQIPIPAIMTTQEFGEQLLESMNSSPVKIHFQTERKIEQPELVDTITDFSSKGPRSEDNLFKPEISAPGQQIISAAMGEGRKGVALNGTSMATPHMAGVVALLKQARPHLNAIEIKSLLMSTSKVLNKNGVRIPLTLQGAGRVQIETALNSQILPLPGSISLGLVQVGKTKTLLRSLTLKNLSTQPQHLSLRADTSDRMVIQLPNTVEIPPQSQVSIDIEFTIKHATLLSPKSELDSIIHLEKDGRHLLSVPVLAILAVATDIRSTGLTEQELTLKNNSPVPGFALAFNYLGGDGRKPQNLPGQEWKSDSCDLESAGYRILRKASPKGQTEVLQFAFKLTRPLSHWLQCELNVLVDADQDGVADQEIAGVSGAAVEGLDQFAFASVLLDAGQARRLRAEFEQRLSQPPQQGQELARVDYKSSLIATAPMAPFDNSTIAVIEAPLSLVAKTLNGEINIKVAALATDSDNVEADDSLGDQGWTRIPGRLEDQAFFGMSEISQVTESERFKIQRGSRNGELILYYPRNTLSEGFASQSEILR